MTTLIPSSPEEKALNNVINKLKIYMERNKQTLHGLASVMGFSYQPFYRLITKKHLPTISSLGLIASHLDCSVSELTHENIFIDIDCYANFSANFEQKSKNRSRVYIPYEKYRELLHNKFFAVKLDISSKQSNVITDGGEYYQLFYSADSLFIDGVFLVEYKSKVMLINVLSVSSKFVMIEEDGKEVRVDVELIKPIAKLFNYLELITDDGKQKSFGLKL